MPILQQWLGIIFVLILVYLLVLAPNARTNEILKSLGGLQIDTIKTLQARG